MTKHYILNLDPAAKYEWDRCTLRDPITAQHPALAELVAKAVGERAGSYLVAVDIQVKVLEATPVPASALPAPVAEVPARTPLPQLAELVA
ncbi:hypothetical protein [Leptodesmis sichuanensis]|uniref:hypothetical protein n=1 Tax=Leptodesmis sichuanensis TaxID=2906798 RepID=UPI001F232DC1|nr:hypothetical protein [Leptodesmis sichuanensis]UIE35942.1 hypothetical protein KIK02_12650 [Leptodesmis sichuanensis A121]